MLKGRRFTKLAISSSSLVSISKEVIQHAFGRGKAITAAEELETSRRGRSQPAGDLAKCLWSDVQHQHMTNQLCVQLPETNLYSQLQLFLAIKLRAAQKLQGVLKEHILV